MSKVSVIIDEKRLAILPVEKNQPGVGVFVEAQPVDSVVASLKNSLQGMRADKAQVCLGLPYRDLILRSFILPEMSAAELNKAIVFESAKYIPFSLAEAYYSTLTFPVVDNKNKMLRILFFAVRKSTVEKYKNLLGQAGLAVTHCEPAICGLVRMMIFRKDIHPADKLALLDIHEQKGIIYFIDAGVVKFMREISFSSAEAITHDSADALAVKQRFFNEVNNSFDFYFRQFNERVNNVLVVSDDDWFSSVESFLTSVNVKCRRYSFSFVVGMRTFSEFAMCAAFGLGLTGNLFVPTIDFLALKKPLKKSPLAMLPALNIDIKEFVPVLRLGVGVAVLLIGLWTGLWFLKEGFKKQLADLTLRQGEFAVVSVEELQNKISKAQEDLKGVGQIPFKSNQHEVLLLIAQHMPPGMWLQDISISSSSQQQGLAISIKGALYMPQASQQVKTVNAFLASLKNDKVLTQYVPRWQLKTMNRQQIKNVTTTVFELSNG